MVQPLAPPANQRYANFFDMQFKGTLTVWNDDRGFGYIQPMHGGEPIFVHVSAWPKGAGRPSVNQAVYFEVEVGQKGKRAKNVQLLRSRRATEPSHRRSSAQWGTATLFAIPGFLILYLAVAVLWRPPLWFAGIYLGLSVITFLVYAGDKASAASGSWRTPESTLHLLAAAGGWPGALLGQQLLRHKSTKQDFRQTFWATVAINVCAFLALASPIGRTLWAAQ